MQRTRRPGKEDHTTNVLECEENCVQEDMQTREYSSEKERWNSSYGQQDILDRWTEYIGDLFDDKGDMLDFDETSEPGNDILESEVEASLKEMKFAKPPGNDNINAELLIASKEISAKKICHLANKICKTGNIPKQMKESVFIPLPKIVELLECGNYRFISLVSHIAKIILRIVM